MSDSRRRAGMVVVWMWGVLPTFFINIEGLAAAETYQTHSASEVFATPSDAWRDLGFRLSLGVGYDDVAGFSGAPGGTGVLIIVQPEVRLAADWSLDATLRYTILSEATLSGTRVVVGLGPTWHPFGGLQLSLGLGYAGVLASWQPPVGSPAFSVPSGNCTGRGGAGLGRIGYLFALADNFSMGPVVEGEVLMIQCDALAASMSGAATTGPKTPVPYWLQRAWNVAWEVSWR